MSKPKLKPQETALALAESLLRFSAQSTQGLGKVLLPRESFLKRVFSSHRRSAERLEALKLNCDIVILHLAITEYRLENGDYWNRDNSDINGFVRQLSFQAITQAFESAGCRMVNANEFVRERAERLSVYAATTPLQNIAEEVMKNHDLPSRFNITELLNFLGPTRISTYKQLWGQNEERISQLQRPSIGNLLSEVHRHWRGKAPLRDMDVIRFNIILEGSLHGLDLVTMKFCNEIEIT